MSSVVGMKDLLKPDADIAMELDYRRKNNKHSTMNIFKVQSHIDEDDAPDELLWRINNEADGLATLAREKVQQGELEATTPGFLEGSKAMCIIRGTYCTNNLQERIFNTIYKDNMEDFLCRKFGWTPSTFLSIDWEAHQSALEQFYGLQQVTVMKYVHGWLATKKRMFREGSYSSPLCELCHETEDSQHIFCCQHNDMKEGRKREFIKLQQFIRKTTVEEVTQAIEAGISGIGRDINSIFRDQFATNKRVAQVFTEQDMIGWEHFVLGRVAKSWSDIGPIHRGEQNVNSWARRLAKAAIEYGVALWRTRNKALHGNDGGVSNLEKRLMITKITKLYEDLKPVVHPEYKWLFTMSLANKLREPYSVQVAWVDSISRLCPDKYREVLFSQDDNSYTRGQRCCRAG